MKSSHNRIRLVTGSVRAHKKPSQYVPTSCNICIVSMVTALTSKYRSRTISPVDMTINWTLLTGIKRQHCPETDTVNLISPFQPFQPVLKMFMKLYRQVKNDFLTCGLKIESGVKFRSFRILEFSYDT